MENNIIIVTGAVKAGIGEAITRKLLKENRKVIGTYQSENSDRAKKLLKEYKDTNLLKLVEVDHSSRDQLIKFADSINDNISGIVYAEFFFEMENPSNFNYDLWDKSIAINLTAPNILIHELKTKMIKGSSIIIITSTEGFIGSFGASAYAATKAAIHNLVKTFANNLGKNKIRVNALATGWIGGVMDTDEVFNMSRRITPLGRLGTPEEIASITFFLLSQDASFINGTVVTADGGYTGVDTIAKYEFEQSKL